MARNRCNSKGNWLVKAQTMKGEKRMRGKSFKCNLCLAFVVSLFPFSTVAQSEHFVVEDDEQNISVSEDVYAEQGNERDGDW